MDAPEKPRPLPIEPTRPYWDGLAEHRIVIPRCDRCGTWVWYPRPRCPSCLCDELTWTTLGGAGTVHSYTVTRQPIHPAFADETPQVQAIVELDEGIRMTTTLVGIDPDGLDPGTVIGTAVEPVFDDGPDGVTLLRFRPT